MPKPQQSTLSFSSKAKPAAETEDEQHEELPAQDGRNDEQDGWVETEEKGGPQRNDSEDVPMQDMKAEDSKSEPENLLEEQSEDEHEPNPAGTHVFSFNVVT